MAAFMDGVYDRLLAAAAPDLVAHLAPNFLQEIIFRLFEALDDGFKMLLMFLVWLTYCTVMICLMQCGWVAWFVGNCIKGADGEMVWNMDALYTAPVDLHNAPHCCVVWCFARSCLAN